MQGVSNKEQQLVCPAACHWPWSRGRRDCLVSVCLRERPVRGSPGAAVSGSSAFSGAGLGWAGLAPGPPGFVSLMWAPHLGQRVIEWPSPLPLPPSAPGAWGVERRVAASPPVGSTSSLQRLRLCAGCRRGRRDGTGGRKRDPSPRRFRACTRASGGGPVSVAGGRLCGPDCYTSGNTVALPKDCERGRVSPLEELCKFQLKCFLKVSLF